MSSLMLLQRLTHTHTISHTVPHCLTHLRFVLLTNLTFSAASLQIDGIAADAASTPAAGMQRPANVHAVSLRLLVDWPNSFRD